MRRTILKQNRVWLFAFADLAFILLISITQYFSIGGQVLFEMELPYVDTKEKSSKPVESNQLLVWKVIVHKPSSEEDNAPYQLFEEEQKNLKFEDKPHLTEVELRENLKELYGKYQKMPIVIPDENSLTGDMLRAMKIIQDFWSRDGTVFVTSKSNSPQKKIIRKRLRE